MSQESQRKQVSQLDKELLELRERYNLLLREQDPVYVKYLAELEAIHSERKQALDKYTENEINAAHKAYEGRLYQIDSEDLQHRSDLRDSTRDFVLFKCRRLIDELPDAGKFFLKHVECPFISSIISSSERDKKYDVELSTAPLISEEAIQNRMGRKKKAKREWFVDNGKLISGSARFSVGGSVIVTNGPSNPISGTIRRIDDPFIEVGLRDGTGIKISLLALNIGYCEIRKH